MSESKKEKKRPLTLVVVGVVLFLAMVQLFISHRLATTGEVVREYEREALRLEGENALLEEEINQVGSLTEVRQKAKPLGMVKASKFLYLTPEIPIALGP